MKQLHRVSSSLHMIICSMQRNTRTLPMLIWAVNCEPAAGFLTGFNHWLHLLFPVTSGWYVGILESLVYLKLCGLVTWPVAMFGVCCACFAHRGIYTFYFLQMKKLSAIDQLLKSIHCCYGLTWSAVTTRLWWLMLVFFSDSVYFLDSSLIVVQVLCMMQHFP